MRYEQVSSSANYPYPDHNIDPDKKGREWCMQYARAAFYDWNWNNPKGVFSANNGEYQKNRLYALGKQPVAQYQKWLGIDAVTKDTWMSIDWSIRPILSGYRDKVISKLMKEDYSIVATAIDAQAKDELDVMYNQIKAKLIVRQLMLKTNPELASHPLITLQTGEPLDTEELEMRASLGEQFNRSKDAELAIELGFYENHYEAFRKAIYEDLFDYGVAGYEEWLGDDNKAKFRRCDPERVVISNCKDGNFRDMVHAGELDSVSLIELALLKDDEGNQLFTDAELNEFASSISGKMGNPQSIGLGNSQWMRPYDKFKCDVLKIKFYTYNESSYRGSIDENGNEDFRKAAYGRGKKSEKFTRKRIQYVYECSWIVGTDKCYNWGMCYDQKRSSDKKKKGYTKLPYKFIAYNFYQMKAQSYMDRLTPYGDAYQLLQLKVQNFNNRAVPSGWWIDLDALENVALNKGGKNMEPKQQLQMFFETGVLLGRSVDAAGNPRGPNWKPVMPIENTAASEVQMFYEQMVGIISAIERMIGYNDITSGNPNPKTLVPGYELANQNTNDALYPLAYAEEMLSEELAYDVLCRMKQGIKKGEISGYAPYKGSLGVNTLRFISIDESIGDRDFGIELQKKSTEQEKAWIMQQVQVDIANQLLDVSDAIMIIETHNAKQAMQILAYKVKKAKEQVQQNQMAMQQEANKGNMQSAQLAAQAAQAKLEAELQAKKEIAQAEIQADIIKTKMKIESEERIAMNKNFTASQVAQTQGEAKIAAQALSSHGDLIKTHVAGEHAKGKQEIANEKPVAPAKK